MYEIELKAHIDDVENVRKVLNGFATQKGRSFKRDKYYKISTSASTDGYEKVRVRTENGKTYLTFKQKTLMKNPDGTSMEVNTESESEINTSETIELIFKSIGAVLSLEKTKDTEHWIYTSGKYEMHIELCNVGNLGNFLEIEVMSDKNDENTVNAIRELEMQILEKCGIGKDKIESKYYEQLLAESNGGVYEKF
ncbi:MAG: class IV adenylate cyclase [Treponemataceae bacterium]|nr:class IV adenylate cyclase [Treponemataceae bacterium]